MASENNDIGDIVKKCKILLLDVEGTTTSVSFVKDVLHPYADLNIREFLNTQWEKKEVKDVVHLLRKLALEDAAKKVEGVVAIPGPSASKDAQIEGLVNNFKWQLTFDRKATPLKILQGLIWKKGYDIGEIKGHVYDDVAPAIVLWNSIKGQKVYIFSSGSVQAQKLLFKQTVAGDMLPLLAGHFDTSVGGKLESSSYVNIAEKIGCRVDEILFLTDNINEAEAARTGGLHVALVSREGNEPLPPEASAYVVIHSFEQLAVSNKRKPDPQEQQVPTKVLKTDVEADVKTVPDKEVTDATAETTPASELVASEAVATENITAKKSVSKPEEPEKMEVEEEAAETVTVQELPEEVPEKTEEIPERVETIIEEVTNPNEAVDATVCDIKPVIEENVEKTDKNETETMETESIKNVEAIDTDIEPKQPAGEKIDEQSTPVTEEAPSAAITIQEITNDQPIINEAEIIDDLVPVVEEPPVVEMEELKNVGEVLDKECDEILLKVQGITNLNNIPVKPMLNSITEETMDAENGENTNDIVESILDSEMELSEKPCEDIDVNTVQEITDAKADVAIEIPDKIQENVEQTSKVEEESTDSENIIEKNAVSELKENVDGNNDEENKIDVKSLAATEKLGAQIEEARNVEIAKEKSVPTEVTNDKVPEPVEESMETIDSVAEVEPKVVETKKSSVVTVENKPDANPVEPEEKKMESEESSVVEDKMTEMKEPVDNKVELKENIAESVDNKVEIKESIQEPVDTEMKSVDTTTKTVEIVKESEDSSTTPVENKSDIKESTVDKEDNKMESEDNAKQSVENISEKESIPEPVNNKTELVGNKSETKECVPEQAITKLESVASEDKTKEIIPQVTNSMESQDNTAATTVEEKMDTEESTPVESKTEESSAEPKAAVPESKETENDKKETPEPIVPEAVTESKDVLPKDVEMESEATEKQVNGNSNGEPEVNQNGDSSKSEELNARLSVENRENGKEVNGANGSDDSAEEKGQGDNKVETEIQDIKVKTVTPEEPRTDPIEQPVEA